MLGHDLTDKVIESWIIRLLVAILKYDVSYFLLVMILNLISPWLNFKEVGKRIGI